MSTRAGFGSSPLVQTDSLSRGAGCCCCWSDWLGSGRGGVSPVPSVLWKERSKNPQYRMLQTHVQPMDSSQAGPVGDSRSAPCRDTLPAVLTDPALLPASSPSRESCFQQIDDEYTASIPAPAVLILALGTSVFVSGIVRSLFCSVRCPLAGWLW